MQADDARPKARAAWLKYLPVFALTFIATLAISRLDVLGLYESLVPLSDRISQRVAAPLYHGDAQNKITVVLLDDAFMNRMGGGERSWPPVRQFWRIRLESFFLVNPSWALQQ